MEQQEQQRQERLRRTAEQGRRWQAARECLEEFFRTWREDLVRALEENRCQDDAGLNDTVLTLQVLRKFMDVARTFAQEGERAEKELEEEELYE